MKKIYREPQVKVADVSFETPIAASPSEVSLINEGAGNDAMANGRSNNDWDDDDEDLW